MVVEAKCWRAEERKARQPCSIPKNQAQTCCDVEADTATYFVRPKESTKHFPRAEMSKIGKIGSPIRWNSILFCRSSRACVWPSFFLRTFSVLASSHANSLFFRFRFLFLFFLFRLGNGRDPNQSIFFILFPIDSQDSAQDLRHITLISTIFPSLNAIFCYLSASR